ncbi:MAG: hypothetical protein M3Z35_08880, partial [Nitrospirota bacterium]|nr:hypothetical protein [Nitrospirota bacterium]
HKRCMLLLRFVFALILLTEVCQSLVSASTSLYKAPAYVERESGRVLLSDSDTATLRIIRDQASEAQLSAVKGRRRDGVRVLQRLARDARAMKDLRKRNEAFGKIALTQAAIGDFENAKQTTHSILDAAIRTEAFMLIAAREIGVSSDPAKLAFLRADVEDIRGAVEAVNRLDDTLARSYVLEGVVKQQLGSQDIEGAQQLAQFITDGSILTTTLGFIAWTQTKDNDIDGALKTLEGIDDTSRDTVLIGLVEFRARRKDLRGARQLAEAIHDSGKLLFAERYIEAYSTVP